MPAGRGNARPGTCRIGAGVSIGYFDQHLPPASRTTTTWSIPSGLSHKQFLHASNGEDLLGRFGISGDTQLQKVAKLSGGERNRVGPRSAGRVRRQLPRPQRTDQPSRSLGPRRPGAGIAAFDGTCSRQPRPLLRQSRRRPSDNLRAGRSPRHRGQLRGLSTLLEEQGGRQRPPVRTAAQAGCSQQRARPCGQCQWRPATAPNNKKRHFPYRKLSDIEADIFQRKSRIEQLNEELADGGTFRDGGRIRAIKQEMTEQQSALKKLYEHWEEAGELNW